MKSIILTLIFSFSAISSAETYTYTVGMSSDFNGLSIQEACLHAYKKSISDCEVVCEDQEEKECIGKNVAMKYRHLMPISNQIINLNGTPIAINVSVSAYEKGRVGSRTCTVQASCKPK